MTNTITAAAEEVRTYLMGLGIETPMRLDRDRHPKAESFIREAIRNILADLNLDLRDDSLRDTPARVAKMYCYEVFYGLDYANFPKITTVENKMSYDEMISTKCKVRSFCEHHLVPFIGAAHIGYLPGIRILGLSKFNRIVDFFSRRPQVQERLTEQICAALRCILGTDDIAVVIKCEHLCVQLRGVQDESSFTVTSKLLGKFRSVPALREEFLSLSRT